MPLPLPAQSTVRLAVLGELASGGMGRVDLARVIDADDWVVAVKRLHAHLARDSHFVGMFLDEVRVAGSLRHPNIVELVGWGRDEDGIFLAMEFVYGAPLSHVARTGRDAGEPMPEPLVAYVGARIAEGLAAAHDLSAPNGERIGLIHRDVSPSNVLLGFDGTVKITDFGVAKATGRATHTATGVLKGKVSYMSPEYAKGRGFDHRADIYSEGVVLFELATGSRPFHAEHDFELLRLIAEEAPPPIRALERGFESSLAELIHRMLEKNPARRPQDGEAVRRELDAWLAARNLGAREIERRLGAYVQRHAADRRAEIGDLLALPGEEMQRGETRARTLTELYTADERAITLRKPPEKPARRRDEGPKTRKVAVPAAAGSLDDADTPVSEDVRAPAAIEDHETPVSEDAGDRAKTEAMPALASLPSVEEGVLEAKTLLMPSRHESSPAIAARAGGPADEEEQDETTTVAVGGPNIKPPRKRSTRPDDARRADRARRAKDATPPPPPRARLLAAAAASFVIVAVLMSVVLAAAMGRGDTEEETKRGEDTAVRALPQAPAAPVPAPPTGVIPAVPAPMESATPAPPATEEPSAGSPAPSQAPSPGARPKSPPARRCTPADFDYPRCLKPK